MTTFRRRRSSSRGFSRGPRVPTTWEQVLSTFNRTIVLSQTILDITQLQISSGTTTGGTIVRSIGDISISSNDAAGDQGQFTVGICVVTKDAFTAGAVPDPLTDLEHDWYYWLSKELSFDFIGEVQHFLWDLRSARKLREGYRLVLVIDKGTTEGSIDFVVAMRNLWKLRP